jgi:hypothetical protein
VCLATGKAHDTGIMLPRCGHFVRTPSLDPCFVRLSRERVYWSRKPEQTLTDKIGGSLFRGKMK